MAGLVPDYNSDSEGNSSNSSSEHEETNSEEDDHDTETVEEKLPLPDILNDKSPAKLFGSVNKPKMDNRINSASVFFNPFKAKEDEKFAILEKHVKLTERKDETTQAKTKFRRSKNAQTISRRKNLGGQNNQNNDDDNRGINQMTLEKRKRRAGVSDSLIPPKKALQAYEKQRQVEMYRR